MTHQPGVYVPLRALFLVRNHSYLTHRYPVGSMPGGEVEVKI